MGIVVVVVGMALGSQLVLWVTLIVMKIEGKLGDFTLYNVVVIAAGNLLSSTPKLYCQHRHCNEK